jgi:signal transduction histidine kinase
MLGEAVIVTTGFAQSISERIASEHALLAARWFARLRDLLPLEAIEVFPSDRLLDHIPGLIVDIADYVRAPEEQAIAANTAVMAKARELGTLRHEQRASLHQVLREYQLLGGILLRFVQDETIRLLLTPTPDECIAVASRIHQAVEMLLQETVETFVDLYTRTITEQTERLKQFTRMATHEWRQPLAPIMSAVTLLRMPLNPAQYEQTVAMIARNANSLVEMTRKLERLARLDGETDNASMQEVSVSTIAHEAARQLRDMADSRGVELRIADNMPALTVDVGRLELAFVNLLSNAIKYSDQQKSGRFVEITAVKSNKGLCEVTVRDNGLGIPDNRIGQIFRRFARVHTDQPALESITGVGLGLAIVDDCVESMQGSITVESEVGVGTTFLLTLPCGSATNPPRDKVREQA